MLNTAVDMLAAALASGEPTEIPYDLRKEKKLREAAAFIGALSGGAEFRPDEGVVRVTPLACVPWHGHLTVTVSDEKLLWLFVGTAVKMNLSVRFSPHCAVSQEDLSAAAGCFPGRAELFWHRGDLCVLSYVGADEFDRKEGVPVPFVCGLLLGSVLGIGRSVFHLHAYYFKKTAVRRTLDALKRELPGDVLTPLGTYALVTPHLRREFGFFSGERLVTPEDRLENCRVYAAYSAAVRSGYQSRLDRFKTARKRAHDEKILNNRAEKKRIAREKYLAELRSEAEAKAKAEENA